MPSLASILNTTSPDIRLRDFIPLVQGNLTDEGYRIIDCKDELLHHHLWVLSRRAFRLFNTGFDEHHNLWIYPYQE